MLKISVALEYSHITIDLITTIDRAQSRIQFKTCESTLVVRLLEGGQRLLAFRSGSFCLSWKWVISSLARKGKSCVLEKFVLVYLNSFWLIFSKPWDVLSCMHFYNAVQGQYQYNFHSKSSKSSQVMRKWGSFLIQIWWTLVLFWLTSKKRYWSATQSELHGALSIVIIKSML